MLRVLRVLRLLMLLVMVVRGRRALARLVRRLLLLLLLPLLLSLLLLLITRSLPSRLPALRRQQCAAFALCIEYNILEIETVDIIINSIVPNTRHMAIEAGAVVTYWYQYDGIYYQ